MSLPVFHPFGLKFFRGTVVQALQAAHGLCVFPAAPGLAMLDRDSRYKAALVAADVRYVDSGFLALAWFLLTLRPLSRISGLRFLRAFLASAAFRSHRILWIHPSAAHLVRNKELVENRYAFPAGLSRHYLAPLYPAEGPLEDPELISCIAAFGPQIIVINLGGGTQEPLGAYLKNVLTNCPTILCTGGAIDFLTGAQAPIPGWADRLFLGWLFRILGTPPAQAKKMRVSPSKRYWRAWRLWGLLLKYKDRLP